MDLESARSEVADAAHAVAERLEHVDLVGPALGGISKATDSASELVARTSKAGRRAKSKAQRRGKIIRRRAKKAVPDVGRLTKAAADKTKEAASLGASARRQTRKRAFWVAAVVAPVLVGLVLVVRSRRRDDAPESAEYPNRGAFHTDGVSDNNAAATPSVDVGHR